MQYCLERGMYTFSRENDDNFDQDLEEAEKNQGENSSLYISKLYSQDKTKVLDVLHIDRTNPILIECFEKMGQNATMGGCELGIVEVPDDVEYEIKTTPRGSEYVEEKHRRWYP